MNIPRVRVLLAALAVSLWLSSVARAEFRFTPGISIREEYNDNVFLTSTNKKDDFITTINPTFNIYYTKGPLNLYLDYGFKYLIYAKSSEEDRLETDQSIILQSTLPLYKDYVFIRVSDFFSRVPIDQRGPVGYENLLVNLTNSNSFLVNPYVVYPMSPTFKMTAGYTYQNIWYESKEGDNSQDHTANFGITKELTSRLTSSLDYRYLFHRPTDSGDEYDRQDASVSFTFGITEKIQLEGSVGWVRFDYAQQSGRDFSAIPWSASARYQLSPALALRIGYSRDYEDSYNQTAPTAVSFTPPSQWIIYPGESFIIIDGQAIPTSAVMLDSIGGGLYRREAISAVLSYSGNIPITITGYGNINKYMNINREDRSTGVNLTSSIPLSSKLTAQFGGNYSYNKYLPESEKVNRYGVRVTLAYALKITTLTLGYAFNREDSNIDLSDYTNNVVWIGARFVF